MEYEIMDLRINGNLFPLWILKNFKKYKLPPFIYDSESDLCVVDKKNEKIVKQLKAYQEFISAYLNPKTGFRDILIYHGLGSGKTVSAINVYNMLYNYSKEWNVFIIIKASIEVSPWLKDIHNWLTVESPNIFFIHYDSPNADINFLNAVKKSNLNNNNLYIIDEVHNFINNVFGNIKSEGGTRAINIYNYIQNEKKIKQLTRIILISGTPVINDPFEMALLFNLLRPGIFPTTENKFNSLFVDKQGCINKDNTNMFQRRIMGLVSYYRGGFGNEYAKKKIRNCFVEMSSYQSDIYDFCKEVEDKISKNKKSSKIFNIYTRISCNFVFPNISDKINGLYRVASHTKNNFDENETIEYENIMKDFYVYMDKMYVKDKNFKNILENLKKNKNQNIKTFIDENIHKSEFFKILSDCSNKILSIALHVLSVVEEVGTIVIYSNFVHIEGLEMVKLYLHYLGFSNYNDANKKDFYSYVEFTSDIDKTNRFNNVKIFNDPLNFNGKNIKITLLSPAGSEGIELANVRYMHILEPYWNTLRNDQVIGRAIRYCMHKDLNKKDRFVKIFKYYSIKNKSVSKENKPISKEKNSNNNNTNVNNKGKFFNNHKSIAAILSEIKDISKKTKLITEDQILENDNLTADVKIKVIALKKHKSIITFLTAIKEVAIDCNLFYTDNNFGLKKKINCFTFSEQKYFSGINPAFNYDFSIDKKLDNGSNLDNFNVVTQKVIKIKGVIRNGDNISNDIHEYWYCPETGNIYDFELNYPVGKIEKLGEFANRIDRETYIINEIIHIPMLNFNNVN